MRKNIFKWKFSKKIIWTCQFSTSYPEVTVGSITKPAIFLGKLGSLDNQKIEKLGIPCTGSSVELVEVCFNFLPSSKNGHLSVVGITYFECTGCETEGNVSKFSCQMPQNLHAMT